MRFLRLILRGVVMPIGRTAPACAGDREPIDGSSVEAIARGRDGDDHAVTPRTPSRIASLSESMTAIMRLTGRISVDDQVIEVLPEFKMADPRYTKITVCSSS
ncbi:hypothetical protein [Nonomuraea sp. NPDC050540]|uniref:hypothetical protein n=1 Tax=Nonomuraea sp. NPDC050540 TaxID=3364367 RepID=UPI003789B9AA